MDNIIKKLNKRDLIFQITKKEYLLKNFNNLNINLYCGFDPTCDSLHIGHLLLIKYIIFFLKKKYNVIIVIGSSTSLIGDPSFKKNINFINNKYLIKKWAYSIKNQIYKLINLEKKKILILDNKKWFNSINLVDFLNNIGNKFKINYLLNKQSIKNRLKNNNLSFREFSYSIIQSYDFLYLYDKYKINLQIGGSDQWGNITSGIQLIKKIRKKNVYGITFPILTKLNGHKFSKSDSNNIWLDKTKTSSYNFYQFFININDKEVKNYLKYFTNIKIEDIHNICNSNKKNIIAGKKIIANELTKMVHGKTELNIINKITDKIFNTNNLLTEDDLNYLYINNFNLIILNNYIKLRDFLIKCNISKSNTESNILINQGSIKINGKINNNIKYIFSKNDILFNKYTFIKKGKKNFYLIKWLTII
ncbi:tyrosine--tRNA ligase [endosymbiont of Euscepes postfasciatus]|uniref:tyrosine--tRNA ligase n=1 Tax=endosymbiont of Euscepes postfasciatus TaxID=650377 RepID=UPI000DC6F39F|nr:tyrosine--tRNA ligase [endosymbiont of Euscepes postfasciatus]BBA84713.1 tyrosine--tRNA ligase [endosymbiont of Euscepes postfasciatus]